MKFLDINNELRWVVVSPSSPSPTSTAVPTARGATPLSASSASYLQLLRSTSSSFYWRIDYSRKHLLAIRFPHLVSSIYGLMVFDLLPWEGGEGSAVEVS